jgi:hypothetical protein
MRQGIVTGIEMGTLQILFSDNLFPVGGISFLDTYHPKINDTVWIVKNGADTIVIGRVLFPGSSVLEPLHYIGLTDYGEPAFMNSWQNVGNDGSNIYEDATYYKDPDGFVHLGGFIKNTSGSAYNTLMFTLPEGYRPDYSHRTPVISNAGLGTMKMWVIEVQSDGDVIAATANNPGSGTTSIKQFISLEGIRFMAATDVDYERIHEWTPFGKVSTWNWDYSGSNTIPPGQWHRWDGLVRCRGRFNTGTPSDDVVAQISERSARLRWNKLFATVMVESATSDFKAVRLDTQPFGRTLSRVTSAYDNELLVDGLQWFADIPESYWTPLTLLNSWVNYTSFPFWGPPSYFKDGYGVVHVRGLISGGTTTLGTDITTLPVDCRPISRKAFSAWHGAPGPGRIDVASDGTIEIAAVGMNNNHLSLDGISFRANEIYDF